MLRVEGPAFDVISEGGELRVSGDGPAEIRGRIEPLKADEVTWSDARIAGGAKGIVAARAAIDGTMGSWAYDLWLCERIAEDLGLPPLKAARIGPAWKVPYGLGKSLEPDEQRG